MPIVFDLADQSVLYWIRMGICEATKWLSEYGKGEHYNVADWPSVWCWNGRVVCVRVYHIMCVRVRL